MICPTDAPQNKKNLEKIPSKGHSEARTLAEFREKFLEDFFSQYTNNA